MHPASARSTLRRDCHEAYVLLDDAFRDAELCIAEAWSQRADVTIHGFRRTPNGLLELTLHPTLGPERPHIIQ